MPEEVVAEVVLDPGPRNPKRQPWKEIKPKANGVAIKPPASPKEASAMVKQLAIDATKAIVESKEVPQVYKDRYTQMTRTVRAHIFSYLGSEGDIEKARREFAEELLANAREAAQHIMRNFKKYPPSVQAFVFTAMCDKSENLFSKSASSPQNAQVNIQVNQFGDGSVDRDKIMKQLLGFKQPEKVAAPASP